MAASGKNSIAAQSEPFTVLPPADLCGVCGGDNSACAGCDGVPNSGAVLDVCGVCGGVSLCVGCDGVVDSGKVRDVCGVCGGVGESCRGCDGVSISPPNLPAVFDGCGTCGGTDNSCVLPPVYCFSSFFFLLDFGVARKAGLISPCVLPQVYTHTHTQYIYIYIYILHII